MVHRVDPYHSFVYRIYCISTGNNGRYGMTYFFIFNRAGVDIMVIIVRRDYIGAVQLRFLDDRIM